MKKINLLPFCCALLLPCAMATAQNTVTLTAETEAITLADGDILTGTGGANTHVTIADGASVTLSGVTITAISNGEDHKWAGLTCLGDATITLADGTTNTIKGGYYEYPGIYVAEKFTLTIEGNTGELIASSGVDEYDRPFAAGIGGGRFIDCGNITINGGVINAMGGYQAAAIGGGGYSSYGSITINGGTITATGGEFGAGIGCGDQGHVQYDYESGGRSIISNITITGGTIVATGGGESYNGGAGIGVGGTNGECGNITISGGNIKAMGAIGGAGIGCGYCEYGHSVCGNITISGGTIEATGGEGAAGALQGLVHGLLPEQRLGLLQFPAQIADPVEIRLLFQGFLLNLAVDLVVAGEVSGEGLVLGGGVLGGPQGDVFGALGNDLGQLPGLADDVLTHDESSLNNDEETLRSCRVSGGPRRKLRQGEPRTKARTG